MASPNQYTKHPSPPRSTVKPPSVSPTGGGFFSKSILLGMFLLALPLFPSQAPDFVGETVLTKLWELIHLLFVGIAVAYGLFSRRNVESSNVESRRSCVDESSVSYVSRILQVSSVFEEEEEELLESSYEMNKSEYGEINQVQAWNSRYFQGKSKVVVARPAYGLDGHVVHQSLGLPVRSLRSALRDNAALEDNEKAEEESLADNDEVMAAAPSSPWHSNPEMMGMEDDFNSSFHPPSVDETRFTNRSSRSSVSSSSSSSSHTSFESHDQKNRYSPSRSASGESLNSNVEESVKEKSLQGSSRSSSPSLPPSPSLSPSPPSPEIVADDSHRRVLHSWHYSDGSLLEEDVRRGFEDELEGSKERGFSKKEAGSKSLKLTAESSWKGKNKSRRSYPPDLISSPPVDGADHSTTRRRYLQQKSDSHLFEDSIGKRLESDHNKVRVKKGRSHDSLELATINSTTNEKASMRAMRSSRGGSETVVVKDNKRNSEGDDSEDYDKSRQKNLPGDNKEVKASSPRCEPQTWRASSKVSLRGRSVRTIRSDRNHGDSSDDKAESHGRTKPRRQWQQELAIVLHQEKHSETLATSEPDDDDDDDDDVMEESEEEEPQVTLEEEEEEAAAWESQSNVSHDHYEVDKKADEFIAKFREQIRLQKLHSGEQRRGGGTGVIRNSHFR